MIIFIFLIYSCITNAFLKIQNGVKHQQFLDATATNANTEVDMISSVQHAVNKYHESIIAQLSENNHALIDNFLTKSLCNKLRSESEDQLIKNRMTISKSTKYDINSQKVITYDKHNVYSMQMSGGEQYYTSPLLHEYLVGMVQSLHPLFVHHFPSSKLSGQNFANKLAVCIGDGSSYDKHYDNSGSDDLRKLTIIYYLNLKYQKKHAGNFRIYKDLDDYIDIEPKGDRLLVFWSDQLVHSVTPSYADNLDDRRWALTLWMCSDDPNAIIRDDQEVLKHFPIDSTLAHNSLNLL